MGPPYDDDACHLWRHAFSHVVQLAAVLSELVLTEQDMERVVAVFTQQMDMANSSNPDTRSQSDHLMENTHIRQLLDGTGMFMYSYVVLTILCSAVINYGDC